MNIIGESKIETSQIGPAQAKLYEDLYRNNLTEVDANIISAQERFRLLDEKVDSRLFYEHLTPPPEGLAESFVYEKREPEIAELRYQIRELATKADPHNKTRDYIIEQYLRRYILSGVHDPMDLAEAIIISVNHGCTGKVHNLVRSAIDRHLDSSAITELGLIDSPDEIIDIVDAGIHQDFDWGYDRKQNYALRLGSTIVDRLSKS